MRFLCIRAPQRKLPSSLTSILPSQTTSPPGRTASTVGRKAAALPAASITTSAPRPQLSRLAAATTSSRLAFTPRVAPMRCASSIVDVDRDDFLRAGKPRALERSQPDGAAADHHHRIGAPDMSDIERRADAGHHAAADQAGAIERDVRRDHDRLLLLHDAIFAEGTDEHQMLELFAVRAPRLGAAVELQRLRALAEIILAQDREAAVAIVAGPAMRVPRRADLTALFPPPHGGTHLLDHACGFMAEHDRHRIAQRAVDHFEVGVTKPRGAHAHQHVRWGERRGGN